ncbi:hypothetical protein [Mangrovicella endophytica]|uniref:hypothetical protein n=1 Tax=Mangrovicella endophytica TaxID=2066697 RepID=UPI000C9E745F|nr:hypothetical protein [Mangrovicella endophytica]
MADDIDVVLQASVTVFGFEATVDLTLAGGPFSIRVAAGKPVSLADIWQDLSNAIEDIAGFGLPDLGAWAKIAGADTEIQPSLWLGPSGSNPNATSVYLALDLLEPIKIGGEIDLGGGVTVSVTPDFSVQSLYIGYDAAAGGLDLRAKVTTPTVTPDGGPGAPKSQLVTYPFPVPAQDSSGTFQIHYLGLGQRVGPTVAVSANDPMTAIFDQLESELKGDDPRTVLTTLAQNFYQPDRGWFIAADVEMKGFRIRVLFNDPAMYGLEITVAANSPTPFTGLLFEILYQKLSPDLGLYYGALTLPTLMRRIPLEGFILILPGFQIWVYTNGDFRINVGWPLGDNSIGISFDILIGRAGFYFAKLRSGDNPGAQASVDYNPILAFGMGVSLSAGYAFNASIFSASISLSLSATFQGLLAWKAGSQVYAPPDHYWFAATASLSVLIQGSVDFTVIRASVTISFTANVGVAFETGYATLVAVNADVSVRVSVKVLFFTIHLSFHTSVSSQFTIGSGPQASIAGPLAPGLAIVGGFGLPTPAQQGALDLAERLIARRPAARSRLQRPRLRTGSSTTTAIRPGVPLRASGLGGGTPAVILVGEPPALVELSFLLQPTATYAADGTAAFAVIASLVTDCPGPAGSSPASPADTSFERLIRAMVAWLLDLAPNGKLSDRFATIVAALGSGGAAPLGDWPAFEAELRDFLANACSFTMTGIDSTAGSDGGAVAVLPMFDTLRMKAPDGTIVDFDSFNPAPADYPEALTLYFQDLLALAPPSVAGRRASTADGGSPGARSVATFLFLDYFLMQARNAANALLKAAIDYERQHRDALLGAVDAADHAGADPLRVADLVTGFVDRLTGDDELDALLDTFDYASAAGIGSRFLLGGLQLPIPADLPATLSPATMAGVPTAPLFTLSGQQYAAAAGSTAAAVLSVNPDTSLPAIPITFDGSPGDSATASIPLPPTVPPSPSPTWAGAVSPATGISGVLDMAWLPAVTAQPLFIALKSQLGWDTPDGPATLLPLPEALQTMLAARGGLSISVSTQAPPDGNGAAAASSPPAPPILASAALQIRLSLSQVPAQGSVGVTASGSPVVGSPGANAAAKSYLPHVYQLGGTDEATRDLIHAALLGDLSGAGISLLYPATVDTSPGGTSASPARPQTIMRSVALSPDTLLVKTNLSTLNQVPEAGRLFIAQALASAFTETDMAPVTDAPGFLRLIWELSVVNAPGYFLYYRAADGSDLPAALFASAGVAGGQTAELDILIEWKAAAAPTAIPRAANAVVVAGDPAAGGTLYAGIGDPASGAPVDVYAPTTPAGALAFAVTWNRPGDDDPVPVGELYHLLQYSIDATGAYEGSDWSLPIGPVQNAVPASLLRASGGEIDHYVQSVPAAGFLRSPSGPANRYGIVDAPLTVALRILDIYGNALPDTHSATRTPLYQDPLVSLGEWPGLIVGYRIVEGDGAAAQLAVELQFDPDTIVPPSGSPGSGIPPAKALDAWQTAADRYRLILDQLTDPNLSIAVTCSLAGEAPLDGAAAAIIEAAEAITAAIDAALPPVGSSPPASPDVPVVEPVTRTVTAPVPFSAVAALDELVVPLTVTVAFSRPSDLVDPAAQETIPAATSVTYAVHPDLTGAGASPGSAGNIMAFAELLESAFQDFDGAGGCLKLAQRAGVATAAAGAVQPLWCLRWSAQSGVAVAFGGQLVFFALEPLSTKPVSGEAAGQTWSNVDLDGWARDFLTAFDAFLAPSFAVAIGTLDLQNGTGLFEQLVAVKQRLAKAISLGLAPLFVEQAGLGDLDAAQDRFEQAMLTALASAFTVTTIIQIPASVTTAGGSPAASPGTAPRLYGGIGSADASPLAGRSSPYSLSAGNLDLVAGEGWMTTLLTVAQAQMQSEVTLPLDYTASYLQHDFEPDEAYLGYTPSAWLKFALPGTAPLQMPITPAASLPVPLIFEPTTPILSLQAATAAPLTSPSGGGNAEAEIAAAMRWIYTAELALSLAAQDTLYLDVTYNAPGTPKARLLRDGGDPLQSLFEALAAFRLWYAAASASLGSIPAAVFPVRSASPAATSPDTPGDLIEAFQEHALAVAEAWEDFHAQRLMLRTVTADPFVDHFRFTQQPSTSGTTGTLVTLSGRSDAGGPPSIWPTIVTADGQVWTPTGSPMGGGSPDAWFEVTHLFTVQPNLSQVSFEFGPLDIMERQSATSAARIVRNAGLVEDFTTSDAFIYRTQEVSFASAIIPLVHRRTLPPVTPAASLAATLAAILTPIESVGGGLAPTISLSATYGYAVTPAGSVPLMAQTAVTLVKGIAVTSPGGLGEATARTLATWFSAEPRSTRAATLTLTITLFGTVDGDSLPLVQFDAIVIPVGDLPDSWWWGGL